MSGTTLNDRTTARAFLLAGQDTTEVLTEALDRRGVTSAFGEALGGLSRAGRQAAGAQVASVTGGLLDIDLDDMLLAGWRKHVDLTAAACRTVAAPGSREVVQLATHRVTSTHEPYVDLLIGERCVSRVHFTLLVEFVVHAVVGTVGEGRLLDVAAGHCEVTATLSAEGRLLVTRKGRLDLPGMVPLGAGILLVDPAPAPAGPPSPT